jgi:WD40 repeat protein
MTRANYDAIGGVEGALAQRAQAIYDAMTGKGEDTRAVMLFRRLFTRLVTLGEGAEHTRRIVGRQELGPDAWQLAQRLAGEGNRLVVTGAPAPHHETAEVVHESLIRHWPTLVKWVESDRPFKSWLERLKPRFDEWREHPQDQGTLLRGGPLAVAEEWLDAHRDEISEDERAYIEASIALREVEKRREEEALAREHARLTEISAAQARTARLQRIAERTLAAVAAAVALGIGLVGWQYKTNIDLQASLQHQHAELLSGLASVELLHGNFDSALRIAAQGVRVDLALPPGTVNSSSAAAQLAAAVSQSDWRLLLSGHERGVHSAVFSPDGAHIVTASRDNTARIWDTATGKEIAVLRGHESDVLSAVFSPDGARIVTASDDKTARIWDAATAKEIAVLRGHESEVLSAAFSPDGARIVTASFDRTARIWDGATGREIENLGHENTVWSAAFSPDGARIVTASADRAARIWDAATAKEIAVLRGHETDVRSAVFSPNGARIVTASWDGTARIWDSTTAKEIAVLRGHENLVNSAAFSPDGARIVTASDDNTARIWDGATAKEVAVLRGHERRVNSAAFSPEGARIVTASTDNTARIWDTATAKEIAVLRGHQSISAPAQSIVSSATFSPDGARIVTTSWDFSADENQTTRVWDAATAKEIAVLRGHRLSVRSAAFSPDGARIVTASGDATAGIWDIATAKEIAVLRGHERSVNSAAFSPDGAHIVTASTDNTARIWDVHFAMMATKDQLVEACARRLRGLSELSRDEMRLAGYPESTPNIDPCEGIE